MKTSPGPLIGSGRAADAFDHGEGRVLRRYRTAHSSEGEADLIDWSNARSGQTEEDVARTWVIMATSRPDLPVSPRVSLQERMRDINVTASEREEIVRMLSRQ